MATVSDLQYALETARRALDEALTMLSDLDHDDEGWAVLQLKEKLRLAYSHVEQLESATHKLRPTPSRSF